MPDLRRRNCQSCRKPDREVGPISWAGLCGECGIENETQAITQLAEHRGPVFEYWRTRIAASVGATIPDTAPTRS
jgi:hypothetical protein